MKISGLTSYHLPGTRYPWVFLRIDTDEGVHGIGQVSSGPNSAVVAAAASKIGWFEEPVPPENPDALRQFRDRCDLPVCVGERLYTRWQFRPILEQKLADYIMPDVIRTGGSAS